MRTIGMAVLLWGTAAAADSLDRAWPMAPAGRELSMEEQLTRRIDEWSDRHVELRARELASFRTDLAHNRAHVRLGYGDAHYLSFYLDGDLTFHDGLATVDARVGLAVRGHRLNIEVPGFDIVPASYQGDRYVEIRVPFFKKSF